MNMDDFYDNDYECLPDGLKELLQHSVHKECGNCHEESGRLRCSRCLCQFYCSADCQRAHFERHKKNCKSIGKARKKIADQYDVVAIGAAQLTGKLRCTVYKINLADLLVKVAYDECDTLLQGRMYYCEALKLYAHPTSDIWLTTLGYKKLFSFLDDRVMIMIMVCGGDTKELEPVFMNCGGHDVNAAELRRMVAGSSADTAGLDLVNRDTTHTAYFAIRSMLTEESDQGSYKEHFFWLLAYILRLSKHRENSERIGGDDNNYFQTVLPNNIREAINGIRWANHGDALVHLKHANPFTREHSPGLFSGFGSSLQQLEDDGLQLSPMDINMMLREISFGGGAPPEMWNVYKKCILESFDGGEILSEFIEG